MAGDARLAACWQHQPSIIASNIAGSARSGVAPSTSTNAVYVYGAGLAWPVLPPLGLRLQYRGNIYKAPDLVNTPALIDGNTNSWTPTAEPMIGVYFRL